MQRNILVNGIQPKPAFCCSSVVMEMSPAELENSRILLQLLRNVNIGALLLLWHLGSETSDTVVYLIKLFLKRGDQLLKMA